MELSTDPEDLSLKLRKLFPQIEENQRGGLMASDSDFSQITQLLEIKRLYEEQEEKWKLRLTEKDEEVNKYMMELRDQQRVIEGRDQVLTGHRERERPPEGRRRARHPRVPAEDRPAERAHQGAQPAPRPGRGRRPRAAAGGGGGGGGFFKK